MKTLLRTIVLSLIYSIFLATNTASSEPILNTKNKNQQCRTLKAWTEKIAELGGPKTHAPHMMQGDYTKAVNPAFVDSVFKVYFGKTYAELTTPNKKTIKKVIRKCRPQVITNGFLEIPFETGSRANWASAKLWRQSISEMTEADMQQASARAKSDREIQARFAANRPVAETVHIPTGKKLIKKVFKDTKSCVIDHGRWAIQMNPYVYSPQRGAHERPDYIQGYNDCQSRYNSKFILPNVYSLNKDWLFVGDACAKQPTLLSLTYAKRLTIPAYDERIFVGGQFGSSVFTSELYDFYVPSGTDGRQVLRNKVETGLFAARAVMQAQCGELPDTVRVHLGRFSGMSPKDVLSRHIHPIGVTPVERFEYEKHYSGTFTPNNLENRLIHDDEKMAIVYGQLAEDRIAFIWKRLSAKQRRSEQAAKGAGYFFLFALGIHSASPCNDPETPQYVKDVHCGP